MQLFYRNLPDWLEIWIIFRKIYSCFLPNNNYGFEAMIYKSRYKPILVEKFTAKDEMRNQT